MFTQFLIQSVLWCLQSEISTHVTWWVIIPNLLSWHCENNWTFLNRFRECFSRAARINKLQNSIKPRNWKDRCFLRGFTRKSTSARLSEDSVFPLWFYFQHTFFPFVIDHHLPGAVLKMTDYSNHNNIYNKDDERGWTSFLSIFAWGSVNWGRQCQTMVL